jgi:hypothetical protein
MVYSRLAIRATKFLSFSRRVHSKCVGEFATVRVRQTGWLVGAVGIETASLTSKSRQRKALPTAPHSKC